MALPRTCLTWELAAADPLTRLRASLSGGSHLSAHTASCALVDPQVVEISPDSRVGSFSLPSTPAGSRTPRPGAGTASGPMEPALGGVSLSGQGQGQPCAWDSERWNRGVEAAVSVG